MPLKVYAVKYPGSSRWRIAEKCKASDWGVLQHPTWDAWAEVPSTAFIGYVGHGEQVVLLEEAGA